MFIIMLLVVILSAVAILYFALNRKRFGNKGLFGAIAVFLIALIITFIVGSQPVSEEGYDDMAKTFDYDSYVNGEVEEGTTVEVNGSVLSLTGDTVPEEELFILDTSDGAYYIMNSTGEEIDDGDNVTITGGYSGLGKDDSPAINANFIK